MAKKVKTPPPPAPRRVQAPKKRTGPRHPAAAEPRSRLPLLLAGAGALVALGLIIGGVLVFGRGSDTDVATTMREAGFTYREVEARQNMRPGGPHVEVLPKGFKYNTEPPTSGLHYPRWILWGIYDSPVDRLRSVHNLEHGGIMIHYGDKVPAAEVAKLGDFYREDPNGVVVAPLPSLGNKISLAAWTFDIARLNERGYEGEGHLALGTKFDDDAFRTFVDAYRFKGPERLEPEDLTPGT